MKRIAPAVKGHLGRNGCTWAGKVQSESHIVMVGCFHSSSLLWTVGLQTDDTPGNFNNFLKHTFR